MPLYLVNYYYYTLNLAPPWEKINLMLNCTVLHPHKEREKEEYELWSCPKIESHFHILITLFEVQQHLIFSHLLFHTLIYNLQTQMSSSRSSTSTSIPYSRSHPPHQQCAGGGHNKTWLRITTRKKQRGILFTLCTTQTRMPLPLSLLLYSVQRHPLRRWRWWPK